MIPRKKISPKANPSSWVSRFADELYSFAKWKVNDEELAKDLVQETFLAAFRKADEFRGDSTERTWLFAIIKNKILDHYRNKYRKQPTDTIPADDDLFTSNGAWKKDALPQNWQSKEVDALRHKEFFIVLNKCKDNLTNQQQLVFAYKYLEDKDADEICKDMDISSSNYWVLLHRARVQLRACLEKNWINQ